ncbi:hypothetical protein SAMN05216474_0328 [Lishizhenia tianjinensis]|uniref:Lipoprotein n=1 Tax=Lishizhenia tianjinensis TaxID=477690 RepID=A0A1I6XNN6_9FLAO|nr:hypothetical protein [Lishizhenia tianjinensis]SFT39682.1 hypothetical protein SAMN05216474_0328 [Lishizhenia tianjinensis]
MIILKKRIFKALSLLILVCGTNSCATIVNGNESIVSIETTNILPQNSTGATYKIFTEYGELLREGRCPEQVVLKAGGFYFKRFVYHIKIEQPGFDPKYFVLRPRVDGLYGWNILFGGGALGLLLVDPVSGAMYTLEGQNVSEYLTPSSLNSDYK